MCSFTVKWYWFSRVALHFIDADCRLDSLPRIHLVCTCEWTRTLVLLRMAPWCLTCQFWKRKLLSRRCWWFYRDGKHQQKHIWVIETVSSKRQFILPVRNSNTKTAKGEPVLTRTATVFIHARDCCSIPILVLVESSIVEVAIDSANQER